QEDLGSHADTDGDEQQGDPPLEAEETGLDHAIAHGATASEGGTDTHHGAADDSAHGGGGIGDADTEFTGGLGGDEGTDQDTQHQHDTPVEVALLTGGHVLQGVGGRGGDAQAGVAAGGRGQWPGDDTDQTDERTGGVDVQGTLPGGLVTQTGDLGALGLQDHEMTHQVGGQGGKRNNKPPDGDAEQGGQGGELGFPGEHEVGEPGEGAVRHGRGGTGVGGQGDPGTDQPLTGAVPRTRGATTGENDAEAEDETTDDHSHRREVVVGRGDHTRGGQCRQAHSVDG